MGGFKIRASASGTHIFDRVTGINVLVEEEVPPQTAWAQAPRQVSIALTNACELQCAYCYAPKHGAVQDFATLCSWILDLDKNGALGIGFGGGEPTLFPRFAELCEFTTKETGLAVTFTTHGHRLTPALLSNIEGSVHFVRVSMDGVGDTYEQLRNRSFSALLENVQALSNICQFGLNVVVNADTVSQLDELASVAELVGASELLLLPQRKTVGVPGVSEDARRRMRRWVNEYRGSVRLAVSASDSAGLPVCNILSDSGPLESFAHIDASGRLKATSFDTFGIDIAEDGVLAAVRSLRSKLEGGA